MQESTRISLISTDLSGVRFRSITSYSINLGRALCQLKVAGAIIWAWAELASYWPSMCCCCIQEWGHNMKIYIQPNKHPCVFPQTHTKMQGANQGLSFTTKWTKFWCQSHSDVTVNTDRLLFIVQIMCFQCQYSSIENILYPTTMEVFF